jgi:hypothetical protein
LPNLESKLYLTKIFLKNSFWKHIPSSMFWECILSPQKISACKQYFYSN